MADVPPARLQTSPRAVRHRRERHCDEVAERSVEARRGGHEPCPRVLVERQLEVRGARRPLDRAQRVLIDR